MSAPVIGLRINNYEIVSLVGEGGMGAVYLAVHPVMGRKVAVKLLRRELAEDKNLVARFINEARAANAIRHPNIIEVSDVGTLPSNGLPYMMMEFLEGETLAKRLESRTRLAGAEAVEIAVQTASALAAAHNKGIVHRDLKPENLFLVPDEMNPGRERVKVLDFGIAKLRGEIGSGSVKTNAGSVMGTPPYMSPEQCRGIVEDVDHRTDIYALGIILFEMLCGAPPFTSPGYGEVLVMHLTQPPPAPRSKNPDIPVVLEETILKALAKKPDDRYATMAELQAALGRVPTAVGAHRAAARTTDGTPVGIAATVAPTPVPPPSGNRSTPKSTTFTATTGMVTAVEDAMVGGRSRKRRALLVAGGVAALVVTGAVGASTFLRPTVVTPVKHAGGAPEETRPVSLPAPPSQSAPAVVPAPAPSAVPVPAPPPEAAIPPVVAPKFEAPPAESVRRTSRKAVVRKPKGAAAAPSAATVAPPPPPSVQPAAPPPPPVTKKAAEKW